MTCWLVDLRDCNEAWHGWVKSPNYKELNGALPTSQLAVASLEGFADSVWVFEAGRYPRLKGMEKTAAAYVAAAPIQFADDNQNVLQP